MRKDGENMDKYLMSCWFYRDALETSKSMKLKRSEWLWIPLNKDRERKLLGNRVSDIKYLIGDFTDEEKEYLIRTPGSKK